MTFNKRFGCDYSEFKNAHPAWMQIAKGEVGTKEFRGGSQSNPEVEKYYEAAGLSFTDEIPWCSAFINWVLRQQGYSRTNHLGARSWLEWGEKTDPRYGAIVVFTRTSSTNPNAGHVGFYVGEEGGNIQSLGGNQRDQVNIKPFSKSRVLGYRWPFEVKYDSDQSQQSRNFV